MSASTQNQALAALLCLYRRALELDLPTLDGVVRAKPPELLPVVMSRAEVQAGIDRLEGGLRLMALLLHGSGLRVLECARLRVKDIDFDAYQIVARRGEGNRDRVTLLPGIARAALRQQLARVRRQHGVDVGRGAGWVEIPEALGGKDPRAGREIA